MVCGEDCLVNVLNSIVYKGTGSKFDKKHDIHNSFTRYCTPVVLPDII
jgi:hypothetical protein